VFPFVFSKPTSEFCHDAHVLDVFSFLDRARIDGARFNYYPVADSAIFVF
jgi:hypothetical protein